MDNIYNNNSFFEQYAQMSRSKDGLAGAGEWHQLKPLFPPLSGKNVLDLGCGYGWHCKYAAEQGAESVLGLDLSEKMIKEAKARNADSKITYRVCGLQEYEYPAESWDFVVSNLVLHYIADLDAVYRRVYRTLKPGGVFLFNIEHPVFTAGVNQDWIYESTAGEYAADAIGKIADEISGEKADKTGGHVRKPLYWPVDNYYMPGERNTHFLGCDVKKQHHTLTQILMGLLNNGFTIEAVTEAEPPQEMLDIPGMRDELRRPMMLLVKVRKQTV
ncbi:MAG: class I SAM-dependent methyltransferase [Lachnospiraceae bacterium]|nr:class I SAM-dependent methyltransferase [Lachnospiraceae bacterium]